MDCLDHKYIYEPLDEQKDEIRLLRLLPGEPEDAISIEIYHTQLGSPVAQTVTRMDLDKIQQALPPHWRVYETLRGQAIFWTSSGETTWQCPLPNFDLVKSESDEVDIVEEQYEALSYTWGDMKSQRPVRVISPTSDGCGKTLFVTENLVTALVHLRYSHEARTLWCDAICINQEDEIEKSYQVMRMSRIYSQASRVIAWLGPEEADTKEAFTTLEYLAKQAVLTTDDWVFASPDAEQPTWHRPETKLPYSVETWYAIRRLLQRPWFDRLWVVQEINLGNRESILQCGKSELSWVHFRNAFIVLFQKTERLDETLGRWFDRAKTLNFSWEAVTFDSLFALNYYRRCSKPRDRIYALLGMASPGFRNEIRPTYDCDEIEASKAAFLSYLKYFRRWGIFGAETNQNSHQLGAPTWVPNLDGGSMRSRSPWPFTAGHSAIDFSYISPNTLQVFGRKCAMINSAKPHFERYSDFVDTLRSWTPKGLHTATYPTRETLLNAYAITLYQQEFQERFVDWSSFPKFEDWKSSREFARLVGTEANEEDKLSLSFIGNMYETHLGLSAFLSTAEGYIGLGPPGTCVGQYI